jgi:SAM-dependent methyltransferase
MLRTLINWNARAARVLDRIILSDRWRISAVGDFKDHVVPQLLRPGMHVWDVGCGSRPMIQRSIKDELGLTITGLDVDSAELAIIERGLCDQIVVADLCTFRGAGSAELVLCRTVLEHVPDTESALAGLMSIVRPGGTIAICVPCRNAPFARLNLLLPETAKKRLLYSIWPHKDDGHCGFPARYDRCTPHDFAAMCETHGLQIRELRAYWWSTYFTFFLPLWATWRAWQLIARLAVGSQAAEGFILIAERPNAGLDG